MGVGQLGLTTVPDHPTRILLRNGIGKGHGASEKKRNKTLKLDRQQSINNKKKEKQDRKSVV